MKRLILLFILLISAATAAPAQSVVIRSGEHKTFTRLVMKLKDSADWSIRRSNRLARVDIDQHEIRFNTTEVFQRIPRTRLLGLTQSGKGAPLELALNCNCEVEGFMQPGNYLVIDVHDPKTAEFRLHPELAPSNMAAYSFNLGEGRVQRSQSFTGGRRQAEATLLPDPNPPGMAGGDAASGHGLSEQRLLAQIQRAASQGLLTPVTQLKSQSANLVSQKAAPAHSPAGPATPIVNIATTTVIDRDMSGAASAIDQFAKQRECLPAEYVAISDWGDDRPFADQVSRYRIQLFGEFDEVNAEATINLAKAYLHFGFGTEARAVLGLIPERNEQIDVLLALADLLDSRPVARAELFDGQSECPSGLALWSAIVQSDQVSEIVADAVLESFTQLPRHLRQQLGPRLSRQFNSRGQHDLASGILRAVDRRTDSIGPSHDLAAAEIETATGHTKAAVEKMEKVVASNTEFSPEALINLIDTNKVERRPLRPDFPELAGAYAAEHRLGELGAELRRVHAISLAMAGRFDEAFEVLQKVSELDTELTSDAATNSVLDSLTDDADDVTFLTYVLPRAQTGSSAYSASLETRMAERLLDLGFAAQAYAILDHAKTRSFSERNRLLRAEISLANGLPHRAMIEVLNLASPEASEIRARAMRANGDFETAGQMLLDAERPEIAARNLWLGDAWDRLPSMENPRYRRLAELSVQLAKQVEHDDASPPLAGARTLLDDSMNTRSGIDEILGALQLPGPLE